MKTRLVLIAVTFLATSLMCSAGIEQPVDSMPIPGNRLPGLEQRLRNLERRLKALEKPAQKEANAVSAPKESEYVKSGLAAADGMLKGGNVAGGANAYREVFQQALTNVKPTTQLLADLFVTSCTLAMASEALLEKTELELAKKLNDDALTGLRRCRELRPEWNAKIMDYVLKKVEQRAAELK